MNSILSDTASAISAIQAGRLRRAESTKPAELKEYLDCCGGDINDAFAFGDAENDVEMFKSVNTGIAMGNACDELKHLASYITADITDDGLYKAFCAFRFDLNYFDYKAKKHV